ncbi:unnamed protein product, partial [Symbiodinium sp. CCMP2456]
ASGNLYEAARAAAEALSSEEPAIRQGAQRILVNLAGEGPTQRYAAAAFAVSGLKSENPDVLADAADTFVRLGAEGDPDVLESATEQHPRLPARCQVSGTLSDVWRVQVVK